MIPKRIELENFLSFGKPAVEFTFTDDEPLWVLCGQNGVGKSAVFDGITYALYGEHRGGTQKAEQLVRHGANGFRVVLEFAFGDGEYRITRSRSGRTTQKVERRIDGAWEAVPGVNSAADVKAWVEKTLGLGYKAFTTSVLLRQGEADKLFSASRDERIAVLKGIIGFERFEEVSGRVHAATLCRGNTLDTLRRQISGLVPVTPEELTAAETAVAAAEQKRQDAQTELGASARRVEQAKQWEKLQKQHKELELQLAEAEARAKESQQIRKDKATLDDLTGAVPVLEAVFKVRGQIAGLEEKWGDARKALRVKELTRDIKTGQRLLIEVVEVERIEAKLQESPDDLDAQVADAIGAETNAKDAASKATEAKTRAETLRDQAREREQEFAEVTVGMPCSRCGQPVNEAHAADERARIAAEVKTRQAEFDQAKSAAKEAADYFTEVQTRRNKLEDAKQERDRLSMQLDAKREHLSALGEVTTAAELRAWLTQLREMKAEAEGWPDAGEELHETPTDPKRLNAERKKLDAEVTAAQKTADALQSDLNKAQGEDKTTLDRLSDPWKKRLPSIDIRRVAELAAERDRLIADRVAEKFKALEQDDVKRAEWEGRLISIRADIDDIPVEGHVPEAEAAKCQSAAQVAAKQAMNDHNAAVKQRDDLTQQQQKYNQPTKDHRDAAERHRVHKKLDDLLGQNGLQRELVRDAEQQIVELANDTLQNLSDGDLSLEQDDEAAGRDDKAFALRVRRAGDPLPIGVLFLSGSQKFRVAVSVALAVGQFASGRARPLEAVIIDEGFGSLDKDGLRAMADELKRLQRTQALRRVILVSHQDEFTDQFPVGYRLCPGDQGTTAAPFRR